MKHQYAFVTAQTNDLTLMHFSPLPYCFETCCKFLRYFCEGGWVVVQNALTNLLSNIIAVDSNKNCIHITPSRSYFSVFREASQYFQYPILWKTLPRHSRLRSLLGKLCCFCRHQNKCIQTKRRF